MLRRYSGLIVLALAVACNESMANDWWQFRGPESNGVVRDLKLPETWGVDSNLQWKTNIPGEGWSAPVVVGKKVFVTTAVSSAKKDKSSDHAWKVLCLDADTGNILWTKDALQGKPRLGTHRDNTYASETPATDGTRIVVYFGMMGVFCYDLDGQELWQKDIGNYPMKNEWGTSSSPVIHNGMVFIQADNEQKSFVVALDLNNGKEVWRQEREEVSNWGSPIIWTNSLRTELITAGKTIRSYDPKDGTLLWQATSSVGGYSSTPSANSDLLVVGHQGRDGAGMMVVKAGATGDISLTPGETGNSHILWSTTKFAPQRSSPLMVDDKIYLLAGRNGMMSCVDAKSGDVLYQDRLPDAGAFWASPWLYNGLVYCPDENGNTFVLKPGPKLELVRVNKLPEDNARYWATSAASDGTLFIRSSNTLYALFAR
ncbi:MAG: PQQ-binding-like beta-propeller repeat protein [Pirellula sp.]|jgi:outer membrane protein assembly factor BamB